MMRWRLSFSLALLISLFAALPTVAGVLDTSWRAPTTNTDGSALTDLASYRVYYSTSATPCPGPTFFSVGSSTTTPPPNQTVNFRLTGLTTGSTYNVSITAVDMGGNESACSAPASGVAQVEIAVTPTGTVNFGSVNVGSSVTQNFTLQNTRTGTVTGTASVPAPFSIVSGSPFTLVGNGATATVTVRFTPTASGVASTNLSFTSDGDTVSRLVTGTGVSTTSTLTASKAGSGTVTSNPAGISCGATCSASFTNGTMVTLTATPAAGSTFTAWSGGGCSGTGTCTVTLAASTTVTATFVPQSFTLTVSPSGAGSGTVTSAPAGIACGATCSASFASGTAVTLTATPAAGSLFSGWSGGGCSGTGTCTVTLGANTTVAAAFAVQASTLTVNNTGSGIGTVTSNPAGISCGSTCIAAYANGTVVTLTATPAAG